mmetsp:Transcript_16089/g.32820  ORF Transcript_16089/g.32820 Transcript_16089/m.32820 type:complete len:280 (+) Transcript_16089:316-1155(+)
MAATVSPRDREESETVLEYALETISGIPLEVKRGLEHIQDLAQQADEARKKLKSDEALFLAGATRKIEDFPFPTTSAPGSTPMPTTSELQTAVDSPSLLSGIRAGHRHLQSLASERVATAAQVTSYVREHSRHLDDQVERIEQVLKSTGYFEPPTAAPGSQVAISLTEDNEEWILGKVVSHSPETGTYKIADEDPDTATQPKVYTLPDSQVIRLGSLPPLKKGELVYAVYPDTTAFYRANVVSQRRVVGGSVVNVCFRDDADEMGITHEKPVLGKHIFR